MRLTASPRTLFGGRCAALCSVVFVNCRYARGVKQKPARSSRRSRMTLRKIEKRVPCGSPLFEAHCSFVGQASRARNLLPTYKLVTLEYFREYPGRCARSLAKLRCWSLASHVTLLFPRSLSTSGRTCKHSIRRWRPPHAVRLAADSPGYSHDAPRRLRDQLDRDEIRSTDS